MALFDDPAVTFDSETVTFDEPSVLLWRMGSRLVRDASGRLVICDDCPCPEDTGTGTGTGTGSGSGSGSGSGLFFVTTRCCSAVLIPSRLYLTLLSPDFPGGCGPGGCLNGVYELNYHEGHPWIGDGWLSGVIDCNATLGAYIQFGFRCAPNGSACAILFPNNFQLFGRYVTAAGEEYLGCSIGLFAVDPQCGSVVNVAPNSCSPFDWGSLASGGNSARHCNGLSSCSTLFQVTA